MLEIEIAGRAWTLLADRAAFWNEERMLVVADVHFGKAAAFRALGIPVPSGTTEDNLARLSALIEQLAPRSLVFLGDLFHARESYAAPTVDAICQWRSRHVDLDLVLVEGNHDRSAGPLPVALGATVVNEPWRVGPFAFCHYPQAVPGAIVMAGHIHPAIRLYGRAGDSVRLPCFWLRSSMIVLPAFGRFTGAASIEAMDGERVIAIGDDRLFELPRSERATHSYG